MKIAYTAWTWLQDESNNWCPMSQYPKRDFEQSLKDLRDCGYRYFENFNIIEDIFRDYPEEFETMLKKYQMEFVNLYHYLTADFEKDCDIAQKCIAFMNRHGAKFMNLEPPRKQENQVITEKELLEVAQKCTKIGAMCRENGIKLNLHPHWGTYIEREEQIDFILQNTSRNDVNLCLDTAHTVLCGMNPKHIYEKYSSAGVVGYVHLKDINGDSNSHLDYPPKRFRALGYGVVDFPGILAILQRNGYDGVLCVELDFNRVNNYDSARRSKQYIHDVLGLW